MSISIADNFSYKGNKPLDSRFQFPSISTMKAALPADLYDGCMAYVVAEKKNYQYDSSNEYDATLGRWREFSGGGGGGTGSSGSVFDITTQEETLYGKTVTVTDGEHVWQGTFDSNGHAQVQGVTSVGELTISASDGSASIEMVVTIEYYSNYVYDLSDVAVYGFKVDATKSTDNVSYDVRYDGKEVINHDFAKAYMDFNNDTWVWGDWTGNEFFMPRPVLISQDYSRKIYLNPDNYILDVEENDVSSYLTGTAGDYNAMMEWGRNGKRIWYKLVPDETTSGTFTCYIANTQLDEDFVCWSFYDANGVIGKHFYTAIYNTTLKNGALRSLSGQAANDTLSGPEFVQYAKANNQQGETYAWYTDVYADRTLINLLMIMVIKSTNSDDIGYGNVNYGYYLTSGQGNTKGLFYGKHDQYQNSISKVFGMEHWFGNRMRKLAGLHSHSDASGTKWLYKLTYDRSDGTTANGYFESDGDPSNYLTGNAFRYGGYYISTHKAYTNGALLVEGTSGENGTYYSDMSSNTGQYSTCTHVGGNSGSMTSQAGAFYVRGGDYQFSQSIPGSDSGLSLKPVNVE